MPNDVGHKPIYRKPLIDKYVERYIESNMVDEVSVYRGLRAEEAVLVYHGQARIHRLSSPVQMGFGDEPQYMVSGTRWVEERLRLHQEESGPRMDELETWLREQIDQHLVEPNSGLGEAIGV